ncbi:MAG TPA: SusD/RagB family nutrient-binding outer membrane lipoprotein, partial [Bacteroidia bacterium]|nr:SusD/RagB family nutrient-binding outer membrane lipoprotein [Bacteroidia bacterium]
NSESALFPYNGDVRNPLFDLVNSGQSGGRTYPSKFLIDHLKATNDPRIKVFAQYTLESTIIGIPDYDGVPNLVPAGSSIWSNYNSDGSDVSKMGTWFLKQDAPGMIMSYAEVCFLKSEAALKGWYSGDAQQFYVDGVTANMQSYTGGGITTSQINTYVAALPPVSLENIITQKWISFTYQNGFEAYNEYRRTGYPVLKDYSGNAINANAFPNRLTYPATEVSLNSANYYDAISHQGADNASTKVWWDQ